jgi:hypothetical protein
MAEYSSTFYTSDHALPVDLPSLFQCQRLQLVFQRLQRVTRLDPIPIEEIAIVHLRKPAWIFSNCLNRGVAFLSLPLCGLSILPDSYLSSCRPPAMPLFIEKCYDSGCEVQWVTKGLPLETWFGEHPLQRLMVVLA